MTEIEYKFNGFIIWPNKKYIYRFVDENCNGRRVVNPDEETANDPCGCVRMVHNMNHFINFGIVENNKFNPLHNILHPESSNDGYNDSWHYTLYIAAATVNQKSGNTETIKTTLKMNDEVYPDNEYSIGIVKIGDEYMLSAILEENNGK